MWCPHLIAQQFVGGGIGQGFVIGHTLALVGQGSLTPTCLGLSPKVTAMMPMSNFVSLKKCKL